MMKCVRPDLLEYRSVRDLYLAFQDIFLRGAEVYADVQSCCGHTIRVFDHNFFHLVKLDDLNKPKPLLMAQEKPIILSITDGFGPYRHDRQRAIYLRSAAVTMSDPDEVWEDDSLNTADWTYIKEFDTTPYTHTILFIAERQKEGCVVPATSYPGRQREVRRRRKGIRIYSQNTTTTP
jgi:hypothetical protein